MRRLFLAGAVCFFYNSALSQDFEIVEAQRRLAIINAGSEQGLQKSDTLWVTDISEKKDHLVAKAIVIAPKKRFSAIEAFQYFGDYRLATGQRVFRVREFPAPLTAPPKITRRSSQKPELTLAEVHRQLLRVYILAGGTLPFGDLTDSFWSSVEAGAGVRVHVFSGMHMNLSGRYIFLRNSGKVNRSLGARGLESSSSQAVLALAVRPVMRNIFVECGPALYATRIKVSGSGAETKSTFFDGGAVLGVGRYFTLGEDLAWVIQANVHTYFADDGMRGFVDVSLQVHF